MIPLPWEQQKTARVIMACSEHVLSSESLEVPLPDRLKAYESMQPNARRDIPCYCGIMLLLSILRMLARRWV